MNRELKRILCRIYDEGRAGAGIAFFSLIQPRTFDEWLHEEPGREDYIIQALKDAIQIETTTPKNDNK